MFGRSVMCDLAATFSDVIAVAYRDSVRYECRVRMIAVPPFDQLALSVGLMPQDVPDDTREDVTAELVTLSFTSSRSCWRTMPADHPYVLWRMNERARKLARDREVRRLESLLAAD